MPDETCDTKEQWSMRNRTIRLGPDMACHFKVASTYKEDELAGEKTWRPGFDFGENEDGGVLVIAQDVWVKEDGSDAQEFWTRANTRVDADGWYLLQGKTKDNTIDTPAGRVPIERRDGERQEWHVIIINTRESTAPSNAEKAKHKKDLDALDAWTAAFNEATE